VIYEVRIGYDRSVCLSPTVFIEYVKAKNIREACEQSHHILNSLNKTLRTQNLELKATVLNQN